jgi:hypothetical protein
MRKSRGAYLLCVLCATVWFLGCAPKVITPHTIGTIGSERRVLIATQESQFKEAVINRVIEELEGDEVYIEVVDLKALSQKPRERYEAVVILNEYQFFSLHHHVRKYLKDADEEEKKKIILITTAGSPHRVREVTEVDAISSASKPERADTVSETILQKVHTLFSSK